MNDFVPLSSAGTRPFADFHVADVGAVDGEAQGAAHLVETVAAGSAGVEVKQVVNGVVDDLENVGVPRDEDFRAQRLDPRYGLRGVVAGIAADVGHQDAHPFALEGEKFAVGASHDTAIWSATSGEPMSPACQISSTSLRNVLSVWSNVPWVSDMSPMRFMGGLCLFYDTGKFREQFCFVMLCGLSSFSLSLAG